MKNQNIVTVLIALLIGGLLGYGFTYITIVQPLKNRNTDLENRIDTLHDMLYPSTFEVYKDGEYICVNITSIDLTVYKSLSSSDAIQWALDNVLNCTSIDILEDIKMDGQVFYFNNKSYGVRAKGGYLVFDSSIEYTGVRTS